MKVYKMQPIRVSIVKTEQPIKSRENMKYCARPMIKLSWVGLGKKSKVFTVDTETYQSGLMVSNTSVFSSDHIADKYWIV